MNCMQWSANNAKNTIWCIPWSKQDSVGWPIIFKIGWWLWSSLGKIIGTLGGLNPGPFGEFLVLTNHEQLDCFSSGAQHETWALSMESGLKQGFVQGGSTLEMGGVC